MKNIVFIISNINKSLGFEWMALNLNRNKYHLEFILINGENTLLEKFLKDNNIRTTNIKYRGKADFFYTCYKIFKIIKANKSDIVHTHLLEANLLGLPAARLAGVKKIIHTRHHATLHHDLFPRAVWYDRFINYISTHIIAPSKNIKEILVDKEGADEKKITVLHHGFDLKSFEEKDKKRIEELRKKYRLSNNYPIIGVISRYTEWKGIQYIIPSFKNLLEQYPNALIILANAEGDYKKEIRLLLSQLPSESYQEISFEEDITSLYHLFDLFVHTPINARAEAFGQIFVEALAAGIPSVFTISGIAHEFIIDKKNALVVNYKDSSEITQALKYLIEDKEIRTKIIEQGKVSVQQFNLTGMIKSLENLYDC